MYIMTPLSLGNIPNLSYMYEHTTDYNICTHIVGFHSTIIMIIIYMRSDHRNYRSKSKWILCASTLNYKTYFIVSANAIELTILLRSHSKCHMKFITRFT